MKKAEATTGGGELRQSVSQLVMWSREWSNHTHLLGRMLRTLRRVDRYAGAHLASPVAEVQVVPQTRERLPNLNTLPVEHHRHRRQLSCFQHHRWALRWRWRRTRAVSAQQIMRCVLVHKGTESWRGERGFALTRNDWCERVGSSSSHASASPERTRCHCATERVRRAVADSCIKRVCGAARACSPLYPTWLQPHHHRWCRRCCRGCHVCIKSLSVCGCPLSPPSACL